MRSASIVRPAWSPDLALPCNLEGILGAAALRSYLGVISWRWWCRAGPCMLVYHCAG